MEEEKESKIDEMIRLGQAPAGLTSDRAGRGRKRHELVFDRPDPKNDVKETFRRMEELGHFKKHPEALTAAQFKLQKVMSQPDGPKVDYQKGGHPLDTTGRSEGN